MRVGVDKERFLTVYVDKMVEHAFVTLNQHCHFFSHLLGDNLKGRGVDLYFKETFEKVNKGISCCTFGERGLQLMACTV